jgi:hypothetical protein
MAELPVNLYEVISPITEYEVDANTKLLIHFNGDDGQQTYTAETGQTVTFVETAQLDTEQKKLGSASLLLDGDSDYVSVPDSDDWAFGTGEFTIECWVKFNTLPINGEKVYFIRQFVDNGNKWELSYDCNGGKWLSFWMQTDAGYFGSFKSTWNNPEIGIWYHVAAQRKIGSEYNYTRLWRNGIMTDISSAWGWGDAVFPNFNSPLYIGGNPDFFNGLHDGWIDEVRISNIARWSKNFTPGTTEIPINLYERTSPINLYERS